MLRQALVTLAAVVLAFLALDDITTDDAASFVFERIAIAGCGIWFAYVTHQLWQSHRRWLGFVSAVVLIVAAWVQPEVQRGVEPFRFAYLATLAALVWFLVAAGILIGRAWRSGISHPA